MPRNRSVSAEVHRLRLQCGVSTIIHEEHAMSGPDLDTRIETYYVHVKGVVQGVGFRHHTVRKAHALRVRGWVANLEDGSVEAVIQGAANQVDLMLEWLRRGPPHARVTEFHSEERHVEKRYERFEQH
jgi:acylphosphatase